MGVTTDWISAVCSAIAAVVAVITLLTVYVAALQVLQRRQAYRLGISERSLGTWKPVVVTPSLLKMETYIKTPTIALPKILAEKHPLFFTMPTGQQRGTPKTRMKSSFAGTFHRVKTGLAATVAAVTSEASEAPDPVQQLAVASWVNFLEAIGVGPDDSGIYVMQTQSDLVSGIVPMRWKGKDLVAICSILGFQSCEEKVSHKHPMVLPLQWSGPLGWMQFRVSNDMCVAEYRRRADEANRDQLPSTIHEFFSQQQDVSTSLFSRLWSSVNGLALGNDEVVYMGGANRNEAERPNVNRQELTRGEVSVNKARTVEDICDEIMEKNLSELELRKLLFGGAKAEDDFVKRAEAERDAGLKSGQRVEVLLRRPGLLSTVIEGEWAASRGLNWDNNGAVHELYRVYTKDDEVDSVKYPYRLGFLRMDESILEILKRAILFLKPDGFYFSPTLKLAADVFDIFSHIRVQCTSLGEHIFLPSEVTEWRRSPSEHRELLYNVLTLCNELQRLLTTNVHFSVEDIKIFPKASLSVNELISPQARDLYWAMISTPQLFSHLTSNFREMKIQNILDGNLAVKNDPDLPPSHRFLQWRPPRPSLTLARIDETVLVDKPLFDIPLMNQASSGTIAEAAANPDPGPGDVEFRGLEVLAVYVDVWLTHFWLTRLWASDVSGYDATIPQTVTMC